jgi:hypothetical protein
MLKKSIPPDSSSNLKGEKDSQCSFIIFFNGTLEILTFRHNAKFTEILAKITIL